MKELKVPILANDVCNHPNSYKGFMQEDNMFCAGFLEGGEDACQERFDSFFRDAETTV